MNTSRHNCTGTVCVVLQGSPFIAPIHTRLVHVSPLAHLAPVDRLALLVAPLRLGAPVAALLPRHLRWIDHLNIWFLDHLEIFNLKRSYILTALYTTG